MSLTFHSALRKLDTEPSIGSSHQVSFHLAKRFQRRCFRNRPIRNKNCLWRPCLLTKQNELSNLYRGPFIDATYQVSVHLAKQFQRRSFLEIDQSEKKSCMWRPCLSMNRDEMSILYRGLFIDASYQVLVHLAKRFQRRSFFRNQTIRKKELPVEDLP